MIQGLERVELYIFEEESEYTFPMLRLLTRLSKKQTIALNGLVQSTYPFIITESEHTFICKNE